MGNVGLKGPFGHPKDARLDRLERRVISQRLVVMHGEVWYDEMQMGYMHWCIHMKSRYGVMNTDGEGSEQ